MIFFIFFSLLKNLVFHIYFPVNVEGIKDSYQVENIIMPEGLEAETGAIDFLPDGRLVACFLRGEL